MANRSHIIFKIHWNVPGYKYIDYIPYEWFRNDLDDEGKYYSITDPRGRCVTQARCKISVLGNQASLYYGGSNRNYNDRRKISIGTTRLKFHDNNRNGIHKVEWEDEKNFIEFFSYFIQNIPSIFHKKPMGKFWLEVDEKDRQKQHELRRPEQYSGQVFFVYRTNKAMARGADHGRIVDRCGDRLRHYVNGEDNRGIRSWRA